MIESGYISKIDKTYRDLNFPKDFLGEFDLGFIQHFMVLEEWESLSLLARMESRKGMLVHFKKCKEAYPEKLIPYTELVIKFGSLIIDFLENVEQLFLDKNDIIKMSKEDINLYRLHAYLYCELYSINKERNLKDIKHTLNKLVITPVFEELEQTNYFKKYNLGEIQLINEKVRELHQQNPFK